MVGVVLMEEGHSVEKIQARSVSYTHLDVYKRQLYTHHEAKKSFSLMLLGITNKQLLERETLKQYFSLVAYEAL